MEEKKKSGLIWLVVFLLLLLVGSVGYIVYDKVYLKEESFKKPVEETKNPSLSYDVATLEKEGKIKKQESYGAYISYLDYSPSYDASLDKARIHYDLAVYVENKRLVGENCTEVHPFEDDDNEFSCNFEHNLKEDVKSIYFVRGMGSGPVAFIFLVLTEDGDLYKWDTGGKDMNVGYNHMKSKIDAVTFSKIPLDFKVESFYLGKTVCGDDPGNLCDPNSFSTLLVESKDHRLYEFEKDYENATVILKQEYVAS